MAKEIATTTDVDLAKETRLVMMFLRRCAQDIIADHTNAGFVRSRAYDIANAAEDYLREHGGNNV